MKSNKSFIITLILIIIIIVILGGYYLFVMDNGSAFNNVISNISGNNKTTKKVNNETERINNNTNNTTNGDNVQFSSVKDYQAFFSINSLINKFYENVTKNNPKDVIGMFDADYVNKNSINANNLSNFVDTNYQEITFYSKSMYVKSKKNVYYYFVNGEEQQYNFYDEILSEKEDSMFMVIVDKNNDTFSITPLTTPSLFEYAQNYTISDKKNVKSNAYNTFFNDTFSDQTICSYYLNYYSILLYLNSEKAYAMLADDTKKEFNDLEDFVKKLEDTYAKITPKLLSYSVTGENGHRTYIAIGENNYRFELTESSIMNFKIKITNQ